MHRKVLLVELVKNTAWYVKDRWKDNGNAR
jgi:hypothetical protein